MCGLHFEKDFFLFTSLPRAMVDSLLLSLSLSLFITIAETEQHSETQNSNGNEIQLNGCGKEKKIQVFLTNIHFRLNEFHILKPVHHINPFSFVCMWALGACDGTFVCACVYECALIFNSQTIFIQVDPPESAWRKTVYYNIHKSVQIFTWAT